jgi:hypothetical protein
VLEVGGGRVEERAGPARAPRARVRTGPAIELPADLAAHARASGGGWELDLPAPALQDALRALLDTGVEVHRVERDP